MFIIVILFLSSFLIHVLGIAAEAYVPEVILDLKHWVEGLVSQKPYSECAWMELSKGWWKPHNHGKFLL